MAQESSRSIANTHPQEPAAVVEPTPAKLAGNFDIYAMYLPFLKKEYLPDGSSTPQFERLYKSILTYQAKNDRTGRCFLPDTNSEGRFETVDLEDPMEEMPFDICINSIVTKDAMGFTPSELASFVTPKTVAQGKGVTAKMELVEEHCGIASASGKFKMARAWVGEGDEPVELFEGYLEFGVKFGSMYTRKRLGSGTSCKFAFWAVRARKDEDGNEIGLEAFL